jgi:hypothetical protein
MEECLCAAQDPIIIQQYINETEIIDHTSTEKAEKEKRKNDMINLEYIKNLKAVENLKLLEKTEKIIIACARLSNQVFIYYICLF